jgi:SAM-dependent methyltransferase
VGYPSPKINDSENVLEAGFGPGQAIQLLSDANASVHIAGIDHSGTMLASARHKAAIAAGRVDLQLGSAEHLPFADSAFDKAFSINRIYFWKEPSRGCVSCIGFLSLLAGSLSRFVITKGRLIKPSAWTSLCNYLRKRVFPQ